MERLYLKLVALIETVLAQRWIRFGIVGVTATLCYFLLGLLFFYVCKLPLLVANTLAYVLSFFVSYFGQSLWTFKARGQHAVMLPKFAATQGFGLLLNTLIVEVEVRLSIPYALAMIIACALVPVVVYAVCKFWVFKR